MIISIFAAALTIAAPAPRFAPVRENGIWWLRRSSGEKIFSRGVCVVEPGTKWEEYDSKNPSYAAYRYYFDRKSWASDAVSRLRAWNFNTIGAWSDYSSLLAVPHGDLLFTPINHMGSSAGFPWLDMWDPALVNVAEDVCRDQIASLKHDERIIGYFSDNELGWWRGAIFKWIWDQKTPGTRQRVSDLLKAEYGGDWGKLSKEFDAEGATGFADLRVKGKLYLRAGSNGIAKVQRVMAMLSDRYYSLCRDTIRKFDPGALYLGDRYISNFYPEIAASAGKYCNVVSTNLNPNWNDGGFVRFPLADLAAITKKPLMITEYYMSAMQNGSGNRNNHSGFPVTETQAQRARGFANTTRALAHNPNVVGAHWFQYYDEAKNGRGDGENYNFGLVDTSNRPYAELIAAGKKIDAIAEHLRAAAPPKVFVEIPLIPVSSDPGHWNRDDAFCPSNDPLPRGDLYCGWSKAGLTLAFYWWEDRFSEELFRGGKVPVEDRSTIEIALPGNGTRWKLRIDEKGAKVLAGPSLKYSLKSDASSSLIVTIPPSLARGLRLRPGASVKIDAKIVSQCRAYSTRWRVDRKLSR